MSRAFLILMTLAAGAAEIEQIDLFRKGEAGVNTYRIPALAEMRNGTLLAVADARHEGSGDLPARISLVMRTSKDKGRTWSAVRTLRAVEQGGVGDASLMVDRDTGRVWCFHAYGPPGIGFNTAKAGAVTGAETLQIHAIHSDDDGETWSEPIDLTPRIKDPAWQAVFVTSGTHAQLRSGRYLLPLVVRDGNGVMSSRNAYSDDQGKTWKSGPAIGAGTDESHFVELADGSVMQNMRQAKRRAIAISRDGGITFGSVAQDQALVDPSCNAGIARVKGMMVFTNAASTSRERMTVKVSRDEGKSWETRRVLHEGPAAYSSTIVLRDGSVGVFYERGESDPYEKMTFVRLAGRDLN